MKEQPVTTLSFRKSPGGFQVLMTIKGMECFGVSVPPYTLVLKGGREMRAESALEYARGYVMYRRGIKGAPACSYTIDESGLTEND